MLKKTEYLTMKKIYVILFFIGISIFIYPQFLVEFTYKGQWYNIGIHNNKPIKVQAFYALEHVEASLIYRILLTGIEKSRLLSLQYVGDKYDFNNVGIELINTDTYLIRDKFYSFYIVFSLGEYDSIVIHSAINFGSKDFTILDQMASAFAVKDLMRKMTGKILPKSDLPRFLSKEQFDDITYNLKIKKIASEIEAYEFEKHFINKITDFDKRKLFENAYKKSELYQKYILINNVAYEDQLAISKLISQLQINFLHEIYRLRDNKYKLISYLKTEQADRARKILDQQKYKYSRNFDNEEQKAEYLNFIKKLKGKDKEEIFTYLMKYVNLNFQIEQSRAIDTDWIKPYELFYNKQGDYKSIAAFYYFTLKELGFEVESYFVVPLLKKDKLTITKEMEYRGSKEQILRIKYNNVNKNDNINIFKYFPPVLIDAVYLVAVKYKNKWMYTTGNKWIRKAIYNPARTCYDYSSNGCYYTNIINDQRIKNNESFRESEIIWSVFFDM